MGGWGVRSIDDAVARRVDRNGDGEFSGANADNFFYLTDVMFSVRAIVDGSGLLHTRLDYTPYGVAMHGFAADVNGDGALTFTDIGIASQNYNSGTPLQPGATNYDPDADLLGAGADYGLFLSRYTAYAPGGSNPTFNAGWIDNPGDANGPDNSVGYDGYWFDLAGATEATSSGLYMVRHRVYDPRLGRWLQRDPISYMGGGNLYEYVRGNAIFHLDPLGLHGHNPPSGVTSEHWANHGATHRKETVTMYDAQCGKWTADYKITSDKILVHSDVTLRLEVDIHGRRPVRTPSQFDHRLDGDSGGLGVTLNYDPMWVPIGKMGSRLYEGQPCKIVAQVQFTCKRECNACVVTTDTFIDSTGQVTSPGTTTGRVEKRTQSCTITREIEAGGKIIGNRGGGYWMSPNRILPWSCNANIHNAIKARGVRPCNSCPSSTSQTSERVYSFRPGGGWSTIR